MEGSKKSVILKTVGICAVVAVVGTAAVLVPVLVANKKNDQATQEEVLNYGDVQVSTNGSTATLNGADGQTIKDGDNDAMFLSSDGAVFGSNLAAGSSYTVTNPNFTPKKGTSSYYMRAKLVYYGVKDGALTEVNPDAYFEVKPTFGASWLQGYDGYYYNVNAGETWAKSDNISKLHINQATNEANGEDVYLFNDNPSYTVATGVEMQYDIIAVEVKVQVAENEAQINEQGWTFVRPLVKNLRLIFDVDGGSTIAALEGNTEEDVVSLASYVPTKAGYNFNGWKLGTETVTSVTFGQGDITVKADWVLKDLSLTYDLDGGQGSIADTETYHINDEVVLTEEEPTRDGYTFGGWLLGDNVVTSVTFGGENITVKAKWVAIDYTLSYELGDRLVEDEQAYHIGDTVNLADKDIPTRDGYTFNYWTLNGEQVTSVTFGTESIEVTAVWKKNLYVIYGLSEGTGDISDTKVYFVGDTFELTEEEPTKENYVFLYWSLDGKTELPEDYDFTFNSEANIYLNAVYAYNPTSGVRIHALEGYFEEYFDFIEGRNEDEDDKYQLTVSIAAFIDEYSEAIDANVGYRLRFAVGSADGELLDLNTESITAEAGIIDLYPVWEKAMKVTFVVDGEEDTYGYGFAGQQITLPTPTGDGSLYWEDEDGEVYTGMTISVTEDNQGTELTLTARWSASVTVHYVVAGNVIYSASQEVLVDTFRLPTTQLYNGKIAGDPDRVTRVVTGWKIQGGDETVYAPGAHIELSGETIFVAATLDVAFTVGQYGTTSDVNWSKVPVVEIVNGQVKLPEFFYTIPDYNNGYYFTGWKNNRTEEVALPGELVNYQENDVFTAQYERRKVVVDLDGGTVINRYNDQWNSFQTEKNLAVNDSSMSLSYSESIIQKKTGGKTYQVSGWEVTSDNGEELYVEVSDSSMHICTVSGESFTSNVITLRALWAEVGTYGVEFDVEEGVTIIDKATGLAPNITYTVKEHTEAEFENDYDFYEEMFMGSLQIEVRGKDGYLPVFTLYTKTGNVIENYQQSWAELTMHDEWPCVPGGLVVKVEWEKAYDIEVRKGTIEYIDEETGEPVKVPIQGAITHLKYGEINNLETVIFYSGMNIPYTAEGWLMEFPVNGPALYSVATDEPWSGDLENVYWTPTWVNIGLDVGSAVINGREIQGQFTQTPLAIVYDGILMIGSIEPLLGDDGLVVKAEIPGHPSYKAVGYELDGEVYSMASPYAGYYVLSGTKDNGLRFKYARGFMDAKITMETYENGQLVDKEVVNDAGYNSGLWIDDGQGHVEYNNNVYYYYSYNVNGDERADVKVVYIYETDSETHRDLKRHYLVEKTGNFIQRPNANQGISYTEEQVNGSWWYSWTLADGGKVYSTSSQPGHGCTLYYVPNGESFDNKVQLNYNDSYVYYNNSNYNMCTYTHPTTGAIVGYGWNYNSYQFYTATEDTDTPIYRLVGEGSTEQVMDCYGKTFKVVYEKSFDILDGEGYTDGVAAEQAQFDALMARADAAIESSLCPGPYNDFSNTTVTSDMLGGELPWASVLENGDAAMFLTNKLSTIFSIMVDGDFRSFPTKIKFDEEDNAIVATKMGYGGLVGYKFVYFLDENEHIYKLKISMTEGVEMGYTFEFNGTTYFEPQEMAETVNYGEEGFGETIVGTERSLWEIEAGYRVEELGEVTQDNQSELLGARVKLAEDVEFETAPGFGMLQGVFTVTAVDVEGQTATVTNVENEYIWEAEFTAEELGVAEITAALVGQTVVVDDGKEFASTTILTGSTQGITVDSINGSNIVLRYTVNVGVHGDYEFRATVGVSDLVGVSSVEDVQEGDQVTLAGPVEFDAYQYMDSDDDTPTPHVLSIDAENEIIRIGGKWFGLNFYADVEIEDIAGVEDIEDLEIGQDIALTRSVYITGFLTFQANGFVDIGYLNGQYMWYYTPYITAVDPQEGTVTLTAGEGMFSATVSLDAIAGIYVEMDEVDYPTGFATMTGEDHGIEMTQVTPEIEGVFGDILEALPGSGISQFIEHPDRYVGSTGSISWSADKTEYKVHLETYEPGYVLASVDEENETALVCKEFGDGFVGFIAEVDFANILTNAEEITEDLVGENIAVRGDFTMSLCHYVSGEYSWEVESVDTENNTVTAVVEGLRAVITLDQLKDVEEITEALIGEDIYVKEGTILTDITILTDDFRRDVEVIAVDTENQTATVFTKFEEDDIQFTVTATVGVDIIDDVEEITADLVGQVVDLQKVDVAWTIGDIQEKDQKMTIDYIFRLDENGKVVAVWFKMIDGDGEYRSMGIYLNYPEISMVSFDANGGEGTMSGVRAANGEYELPECDFEAPEGKKFAGWTTDLEGDEVLEAGETYDLAENTTFYAVWEDIEIYNVSFDANGGSGTMQGEEVSELDANYELPECTFEAPEGKQFAGWATSANGEVISGDYYELTGDATFYAIWEDERFTVSFHSNGGSGTMNPVADVRGEYTLPANGFSAPKNQRFAGWATSPSGEVISTATYEVMENTVFYAIWEDDKYTISFNSNGGSGTMEPIQEFNGYSSSPACTFTAPVGQHFVGWSLDGVNLIDKFELTEDVVFYAIWENDVYTVSFNSNGGSGYMSNVNRNYGDYTLPANGFTAPVGQHFAGWSTTSSGEVISSATYAVTESVEFYAIWENDVYTVSFNSNGGSGYMSNVNRNYGDYTLPANEFTAPTHKRFAGWATSAYGEVIDSATYAVTGNIEFYAIWEDDLYTISFNSNGGSGSMNAVQEFNGDSYILPANGFTAPTHYEFAGWAIGSADATPVYDEYETITVTGDVTVYAVWTERTSFTISFNANGGSGTMNPVLCEGNEYELPECTFTAPEGYMFDGWEVNGVPIGDPGCTYNVYDDVTIYATWDEIPYEPVEYTITFYANNGSGDSYDDTAEEGDYMLPECDFEAPEHYKFAGWATDSEGNNMATDPYDLSGNVDFYAIWTLKATYTVSFNSNGGSGTMNDIQVEEGEYELPACTFTAPEGYEFGGWAIDDGNSNLDLIGYDGEVYDLTGAVTFYATWDEIIEDPGEDPEDPGEDPDPTECIITFYANDGSDDFTEDTAEEGEYELPACTFTAPEGYEFVGWATDSEGNNMATDPYDLTGDVDFYAIWQEIQP